MAGGWKPIHFGLAGMMLVFGSFNTLSVKWADTMTSESVDGKQKSFNHPFLQATGVSSCESIVLSLWRVTRFQGCSSERWCVCWLSGSLGGGQADSRRLIPQCLLKILLNSSILWYGDKKISIQNKSNVLSDIPASSTLWHDRHQCPVHRPHAHLRQFIPDAQGGCHNFHRYIV